MLQNKRSSKKKPQVSFLFPIQTYIENHPLYIFFLVLCSFNYLFRKCYQDLEKYLFNLQEALALDQLSKLAKALSKEPHL